MTLNEITETDKILVEIEKYLTAIKKVSKQTNYGHDFLEIVNYKGFDVHIKIKKWETKN
jgi:hypothetical protein